MYMYVCIHDLYMYSHVIMSLTLSVFSSIDGPREGAVPEVSRLDDTPTTGPATLPPSSVAAHPPDDYTTTAPRARRRSESHAEADT